MAGINLSSVPKNQNQSRRVSDTTLVVIGAIFLVTVIGFGGLRWYLKTLDDKIALMEVSVGENADMLQGPAVDRVAQFQDRLTLLSAQQASDNLNAEIQLRQLETLILPQVKLTKYRYDKTEKFITMTGETDTLKSVAQQIISLKSDALFSGVVVETLGNAEGGRTVFSLRADF
ncbi:MAG: hypothetical protein ACSLEX_01625 [Minisyncoccota bacterium]